jgi:hypothetical protein
MNLHETRQIEYKTKFNGHANRNTKLEPLNDEVDAESEVTQRDAERPEKIAPQAA